MRIWLGRLLLFILIFGIVLAIHLYAIATSIAERERQVREIQPEEPVYRDREGNRVSQADHDISLGYDKAREMSISSHAECKGFMGRSLHETGCHHYVTEQKQIGPHVWQYHDGTKPLQQCLAEIDGYWRPLLQDMREQGEESAAVYWNNRGWLPEREACQQEAAAQSRQ